MSEEFALGNPPGGESCRWFRSVDWRKLPSTGPAGFLPDQGLKPLKRSMAKNVFCVTGDGFTLDLDCQMSVAAFTAKNGIVENLFPIFEQFDQALSR